jgi:hypothetical protein
MLRLFFLELHGTTLTFTTQTHTHPMNTRTQTYPCEHFRRIEPADLEIHEVTTDASLPTGTSPTTKSIAPLDPEINS